VLLVFKSARAVQSPIDANGGVDRPHVTGYRLSRRHFAQAGLERFRLKYQARSGVKGKGAVGVSAQRNSC
jgi:hypothetical protein